MTSSGGLNYRMSMDNLATPGFFSLSPARETFRLVSAFLHDDVTLAPDRLHLVLGAKLEHNSFTGTDVQPNVRMLWKVSEDHVLWAAASRAARTPSRADRDSIIDLAALPPFAPGNPSPLPVLTRSTVQPGMPSVAEIVEAIEAGYRTQLAPQLSLDVTAFANRYSHLRSVHTGATVPQLVPAPFLLQQLHVDNALSASTRGLEASVDWRPAARWRLQTSYSLLHASFPVSGDPGRDQMARMLRDSAPAHQLSVRSMFDLSPHHTLDL